MTPGVLSPLSSRSNTVFDTLPMASPPRDGLKVKTYALVERCRTVSRSRLLSDRLAHLTEEGLATLPSIARVTARAISRWGCVPRSLGFSAV